MNRIIMFMTCLINVCSLKPIYADELLSLKYVERDKRIANTVEDIYNKVLAQASKGGYYAYHWNNPGVKWEDIHDTCCVFDEQYGYEVKKELEVLFPDSNITYFWPKSNDFEIWWDTAKY